MRDLDTSELGPIRVTLPKPPADQVREALRTCGHFYAEALAKVASDEVLLKLWRLLR